MTGWHYVGVARNYGVAHDCHVWTNGEEVAYVGTWEYSGRISNIPPRTVDTVRRDINYFAGGVDNVERFDDVSELLDEWGVESIDYSKRRVTEGWQYMGEGLVPNYHVGGCYIWTDGKKIAFVDTARYDGPLNDSLPLAPGIIRRNIEDYGYDDVVELLDDWGVEPLEPLED